MLLNAQLFVVVFHARLDVPQTLEHRAGPRSQQRAGSGNFGRMPREVHVNIKSVAVKFQTWFARAEFSIYSVKGLSWHQVSVAIDDHDYPSVFENSTLTLIGLHHF